MIKNIFDSVNYDPYLSQFKYHLLLHRVNLNHQQYNQFSSNLYRQFKANLNSSSIYIVQIIQSYDHFVYDIAVGFRRDSDAINIYNKNRKIYISGKEVEIQLAEAFKIYIESREGRQSNSNNKNERKRISPSHGNSSSSSDYRRRRKESYSRSRSYSSKSRSPSESRSRSRERRQRSPKLSSSSSRQQREKQSFQARLFLPLIPKEWSNKYVQSKLREQLKCSHFDLRIDQKRGEVSSVILKVYSQSIYNELLSGYKIGDHSLLFLREEEVESNGLKPQLRKYQFRAQKIDMTLNDTSFDELTRFLINFKEFHLKVVLISCLENVFIVTTQTRISNILKFLKLSGWKFEAINFVPKLNPSLQERWFKYIDSRNYDY